MQTKSGEAGRWGKPCSLRRYDNTLGFGGLTIDKIFVILLIALFVIGPDKLPSYAKRFGELVRSGKRMADGAKDRLRDEMGPEFEDVTWKQLDPRQYDPRRIIRDALLEDEREAQVEARKSKAAEAVKARHDRVQARADAAAAGGAATLGAVAGAAALAAAGGLGGAGDSDGGGADGGSDGAGTGAGSQDPALTPADLSLAQLNFDDEAT